MMAKFKIENPFRPGAGHMPPYLAGRETETREFRKVLDQTRILENPVLTGLRGLGKTVLLETFKPMAIQAGWLWAGTDLSESTSISEEHLAIRLITDLSVVTASVVISGPDRHVFGFSHKTEKTSVQLDFATLQEIFVNEPGLIIDKLKAVLERVWPHIQKTGKRGVVFAYDEAQNLADHASKEQYPLSLLLDLFQSIQKKGIPYLLALTGLPTLFAKLVAARTFAERMFHMITLAPLTKEETIAAIRKPMESKNSGLEFTDKSVEAIYSATAGYPYFIQFVCRECFDVWAQAAESDLELPSIPMASIIRKLDSDFFAGRWAKATDRQRELLAVIATLPNCDTEFSVQDVIECKANASLGDKSFGSSHVNQMLASLIEAGLIYKNRHGRYMLAVPLLSGFIRRNYAPPT